MAHAVVMQVNLVGDAEEGMKMLDEVVIPLAKAQPGFQRGTWMHSEAGTGTGVMVFDTEDHASAGDESRAAAARADRRSSTVPSSRSHGRSEILRGGCRFRRVAPKRASNVVGFVYPRHIWLSCLFRGSVAAGEAGWV